MIHEKNYLHDEVVEGTAEQLRLNNLKTRILMLRETLNLRPTDNTMLNMINGRKDGSFFQYRKPPIAKRMNPTVRAKFRNSFSRNLFFTFFISPINKILGF